MKIFLDFFYYVGRAVFNEPARKTLTLGTEPLIEEERIEKDLSEFLDDSTEKSAERPLFVIGAWGSGKTHRVLRLKEKNKKFHFLYKSYFSIQTLDDAYQHLLSWTMQCILFLVYVNLVLWFSFDKSIFYSFFGIIIFIFFRNKLKTFYLFGSALRTLISFLSCKKHIVLIDDLDRSSLSDSDQWALLSNLWYPRTKYIVLFGYVEAEDKGRLIEKAAKLNGQIVLLPLDENTNYQLALKNDSEFESIFNKNDWLNYIAPRDLVRILQEVKSESENMGKTFKKFLYLNKFIEYISAQLKLNNFDRQKINFGGTNISGNDQRRPGQFIMRFTTGTENSPPLAVDIIQKVYDSLRDDSDVYELWNAGGSRIAPRDDQKWRDGFPTLFRFEMNKQQMMKLYGFRTTS